MLSIPTLWVAFVVNFLALALVWTYVVRSYPNFGAARYWMSGAYCAAFGAAILLARGFLNPLVPIIFGNALMLFAGCLGSMGVRHFYRQPVLWLESFVITGVSVAGLALFATWRDDMAVRIFVYSLGQSIPLALTLKLLLRPDNGRASPGAFLAGGVAAGVIAVHVARSIVALLHFGGELSFTNFNAIQAIMVVALVFLAMAWNFGFLLMAIDRLRAEMADLALIDDLTGVANRRRLMQRMHEECGISVRTNEPFALMAIDLDGFKTINDTHGHAAGDACLRHFTDLAQSCLRTGDTLARTGGDEFCVLMPATTQREAIAVARRIVELCSHDVVHNGRLTGSTASIGIAPWTREIGMHREDLVGRADQALYAAKKEGKNRYVVYDQLSCESQAERLKISA